MNVLPNSCSNGSLIERTLVTYCAFNKTVVVVRFRERRKNEKGELDNRGDGVGEEDARSGVSPEQTGSGPVSPQTSGSPRRLGQLQTAVLPAP